MTQPEKGDNAASGGQSGARLTRTQMWLLGAVADADGYITRDGNEDRTMRSLRRRGLVSREIKGPRWRLTDAGIEVVASWDARGSM